MGSHNIFANWHTMITFLMPFIVKCLVGGTYILACNKSNSYSTIYLGNEVRAKSFTSKSFTSQKLLKLRNLNTLELFKMKSLTFYMSPTHVPMQVPSGDNCIILNSLSSPNLANPL